jgi:hypothetical protein
VLGGTGKFSNCLALLVHVDALSYGLPCFLKGFLEFFYCFLMVCLLKLTESPF